MKIKSKASIVMSALMIMSSLTACTTKQETKDQSSSNVKIEVAKTVDVENALKDKNSIVLDARSNDAYNGWKEDGVKIGGHIKGAKDFSARWLKADYDEKENLEKYSRDKVLSDAIKNKELSKDKSIIVYDTNGKDAKEVANFLAKKGMDKIKTYDANEWVNSNKPMESYKNYALLVSPNIVKSIVDGKTPESFTDIKNVKIVDVRWGDNKESGYLDGHIPTAIHINTDSFEPPKKNKDGDDEWKLADDKTLEKLLVDNGITANDTIIATSPEPMAASRFAVICKYMGVKDVRVMNGGIVGWTSQGYKLDKKEEKAKKADSFRITVPANPDVIDTLSEIKSIMDNKVQHPDFQLIDNRTIGEFNGEVTGYSYHKKKGRIPGAIFGHAGIKNSSSMYYYRNIDKTMRNQEEIEALWKKDGIDSNKHMSFFCGSGWRAAEILWYANVMGHENASLFSDGWIGWSNAGYKIETGAPKK
ncbi:sulfurtransferase [Peptostreptococcus equinus]|uniref:Rhodanese-like domain-containing protein n=1 Tax=Peptostreptococcus equinus TaxID=3003601 RepID=A0ABY7JL22_9FIRM|nr:rhodanese-like domain-containing protein [Peptostreptococcus sp. CBA3647]WAW14050.1 rhodanese-like domain-containing protein [Peptostreptococcus sp. CBA3647]